MKPADGEGRGSRMIPGLPDRVSPTLRAQHQPGSKDTPQLSLDSYRTELAFNARDSGTRVALENAAGDPDVELLRDALDDLIDAGPQFTTDDLPHVAGRGVMGASIQAAVKQGRIESVGRTRSRRIQAHGRFIDVWQAVRT